MEVRFAGRMRDKRATCRHCGSEVDLPDAYQRVERRREQGRGLWRGRTVEETVIETRSDGPRDPSTEEELARWLRERGVPDVGQEVGRLWQGQELHIYRTEATGRRVTIGHTDEAEGPDGLPRMLTPEEIIQAAGGPLPPEERRKCPQCGATISKRADWCQWCGTRFSGTDGTQPGEEMD
jgi:hypothetical protein